MHWRCGRGRSGKVAGRDRGAAGWCGAAMGSVGWDKKGWNLSCVGSGARWLREFSRGGLDGGGVFVLVVSVGDAES